MEYGVNREEYLKNKDYQNYIQSFDIRMKQGLDNGYGIEEFQSGIFATPHYKQTSKFGILYSNKCGSSFIRDYIDKNNLNETTREMYSEVFIHGFQQLLNMENPKNFLDFTNILRGKSEKDLIIVTRFPTQKWLSGIWPQIAHLVKESANDDVWSHGNSKTEEIIYKELKHLANVINSLSVGHSTMYNEAYYNLLTLHPDIDRKKLRIINIDTLDGDLKDLFSEYYDFDTSELSANIKDNTKVYSKLINHLFDIFKKDRTLQHLLAKTINRDLHYLNRIQREYGDCFYKPNKKA